MLVWPQKKALVLKSRNPERLINTIPAAKSFTVKGVPYIAVPDRMEETRVLRAMGYNAPAPIRHHYDWPGRFKPFSAQLEAAAFLSMYDRAFKRQVRHDG
ncbi:MAG: hypothetical protein P8N72_04275 [Flavimaricola sp.]|nr:hypothetical protein [Flavimaricola sp.]